MTECMEIAEALVEAYVVQHPSDTSPLTIHKFVYLHMKEETFQIRDNVACALCRLLASRQNIH
jgi:hypothetical protein